MVNENEINETHWNPLTQKQENTFGFTKKEEILNFAQQIIQKHAPEELRNYPIETKWLLKEKNWANISHWNAEPQYGYPELKRNRIVLNISKNLLHPEIPLILKKIPLVHELTHLFLNRSMDDYTTPGCHGKDLKFNQLVNFYKELGWLKREFKKRLNWELNNQWFINWSKKNGKDEYFLCIKEGVFNTKNVLKAERFLKLIAKKLKIIKIKGW